MEPPRKELKRAFALVDSSVKEAIAKAQQCGRKCACGSNCPQCCKQPIPLTPAELMLIAAHIRHELAPDVRELLKGGLQSQIANPLAAPCPFLACNSCAIYPVRPIACRRFLVSGRPCAAGEDACATRPHDLIVPDPAIRNEALALLLPWHIENRSRLGLPDPEAGTNAKDWLRQISTVIQAVNWSAIL